jgi:YtkA-like
MNYSVRLFRFRLRRGRHFPLRFGGGVIMLVGLASCICLLAVGCERRLDSEASVVVEHEVVPRPPRVGTATITLSVTDATGRPVSGAVVKLEGDMSHAGMSPVFGEARQLEPGRYRTPLKFTMAGDWVILIHLTLPDGRKVERQFDVKGVEQGVGDVSD